MLPEENGFETIVKLKANTHTSSIPVIFLTALSDVDSKVKGFELGAVDFITKPFHPAEIRARTRLHIKLSIATNALIESQAEKLKLIESAQKSMLIQPEDMPDAAFEAYYASLQEAGGDFYHVIKITDNTYGYFVADVAGHDIATSFVTAAVNALLKQNCSPIYSPVESMRMINQVIFDVLPDDKYLTACYLTINRKTCKAGIVNMGHPPVLYLPVSGDPEVIISNSDVLGAFRDVMYTSREIKVKSGDRFYIYSDGLVENVEGNKLWSSNLDGLLKDSEAFRDCDLKTSVKRIKNRYYPHNRKPDDDIVILGIEV